MSEEKPKRKRTVILVVSVLVVLIGVIGITYAYFTAGSLDSDSSITVTTAKIGLVYESGSTMSGVNIAPGWTESKTFTVKNNSTVVLYYEILWTDVSNTFVTKEDLVYSLTCISDVVSNTCSGVSETIFPSSEESILANIEIEPNELHTYTLTVTYKDQPYNQIDNMGATYAGRIVVRESEEGSIAFVKNFGGSGAEFFYSVQETSDGGYVAVGYSDSIDGDLTGLNKGGRDCIIVKYNSSGDIDWNKNFGGTSSDSFGSVQETSDGGYIVVGYSQSTDVDLLGLNKGGQDAIIVKYDSSGNVIWNKNFGGSSSDNFEDVKTTGDGGYIVVGYSYSTNGDLTGLNKGSEDAIIVKYDSSGNVVWNKNFGGNYLELFINVVTTLDGGGYVAVGYSSSTDGDLTGLYKGGSGNDAIIVKYDSSGNVVWNKNFGGTGDDTFSGMALTMDGGYIAVGSSSSTNGDLTSLNKGSLDAITVKYDSSGNVVWNKNFGGTGAETFYGVAQTSDGGYMAVGQSTSADGDITGLNKGSSDAIIVKYDSSGNVVWNKNFGGSNYDTFRGGALTSDGGYTTVGYSMSNDGDFTSNKGMSDAFIVKGK